MMEWMGADMTLTVLTEALTFLFQHVPVKIKLTPDQSCNESLDDRASRVVSDNNCVVVVLH